MKALRPTVPKFRLVADWINWRTAPIERIFYGNKKYGYPQLGKYGAMRGTLTVRAVRVRFFKG